MTTPKNVVGIDPGFTGGWAVVAPNFDLLKAGRMPVRRPKNTTEIDVPALAQILEDAGATRVYVEFVTSRPRQAHQFRFGLAAGIVHGVVEALGFDLRIVAPQTWRGSVGLQTRAEHETTSVHKARSRALASKLWPNHAPRFAKTLDDGAAEAALIAFYGMQAIAREEA
jgi:crossover junction endodeoxyribonuclease RuvC